MSSNEIGQTAGEEKAPYIGALLRLALQAARDRATQALIERGFDDVINQAYAGLFQYPPIDGMRPSDLARRLGISKQALNHLLGQVEKLGYVERRAEQGSRGSTVYFTERGWLALNTIVTAMRDLEDAWRMQIGKRRFAELKAALKDLTGET